MNEKNTHASATRSRDSVLSRVPALARWALVAGWMAVLFRLSALPGSSVPGRFAALGHLGIYTVLGMLAWYALAAHHPYVRAIALAVIISSAYGVTDEWHQSFVPGRMPDIADWGVDTIGALMGASVAYGLSRLRRTR